MTSAKRPPKVQRWIDLIAALLRFHYPVTFEQLSADVPAYANAGQAQDARMRMFERDKDELRELGVAIETAEDENGSLSLYRLKSRSFYLPYIQVAEDGAAPAAPHRPQGLGYQSLPILAFEPDELEMIARAAKRVQQMRHPTLAADAATAVRKLAFDVAVIDGDVREVVLSPFAEQDPAVLDVLDDAVRRRKRVELNYRSIERDVHSRRTVEPYGLLFLSGQWYLVARDATADALRHFRVSRISGPVANPAKPQSPDFEQPPSFDLWSHAVSRQAWELGDGDAVSVSVKFDAADIYAAAGAELGAPDADVPGCRRFTVRRPDAFVRWLLSFGGAATPITPDEIVTAWRESARQVIALYSDAA
jgi:proteasome accessory factor B